MQNSRREFIRKSLLLSGITDLSMSPDSIERFSVNHDGDRLVLLGTQGGPFIRSYKQTPSANLLVYKNIPFVIDTGYGATFKLKEVGINLSTLKYIFITHLHSDHCLDLGPLLYNAWIAGLVEPISVYGPAGLNSLLNAYWHSNSFDIDTRIKDEKRPDIRRLVIGHEISEGIQLANSDYEVSALKNLHPPIDESYSFKFKLGNKVIVFSGDTQYYPELGNFATGADYLIHEVMYGPGVDEMIKRRKPQNPAKLRASIMSHHTPAEDVGRIAKAANVKHLILTHFVPPDDKSLTEQTWINAVSTSYSGQITIGKDLLQFPF
jgi:ribonuclease BN (tRNA processing enzyme)